MATRATARDAEANGRQGHALALSRAAPTAPVPEPAAPTSSASPTQPADTPAADPDVARAVADARAVAEARAGAPSDRADRADRVSAALLGGGYLVLCATLLTVWRDPTWADAGATVLLGLAHGMASRFSFESKGGSSVPTAPIFVASLFLVPLPLVPTVVLLGLLSGSIGTDAPGGPHRRILVPALSGWNAVGPVLVLALLDEAPDVRWWPWYLLAFASQFVTDALVAFVRVRALGMSWRVLPRPMAWTYAVDAMLAPIGLTAVIACDGSLWAIVLASTPIGVLALLARDRAEHLEQAVAISEAFEAAIETARQDALTGIGNRRAWNEATTRAAVEFAADPLHSTVTVVMGDLDRLKQVNDTHGHEAGDDLIRAAAQVFLDVAPPGALVARLGGDEFGMLVVGAGIDAMALVGSVRERMQRAPTVHGVAVSLSVGAASCPPLADVEAILAAADSLTFADKAARRVGR